MIRGIQMCSLETLGLPKRVVSKRKEKNEE